MAIVLAWGRVMTGEDGRRLSSGGSLVRYPMVPEELSRWVGLPYVGIRQAYHIWQAVVNRVEEPVALAWSDGSFVPLDAKGDWMLKVEPGQWRNYYRNTTPEELEVVAAELGLWVVEGIADSGSVERELVGAGEVREVI